MKALVWIILLGISSFSAAAQPKADDRLIAFLAKVDQLHSFMQNKSNQATMPNLYKPRADALRMPNMDLKFFDHDTGLQYSSDGKIYDDKLAMVLDVNTGIVYDFHNKKHYSREEIERIKEEYSKKKRRI